MPSYQWNGTAFNTPDAFVASQFFIDDQANIFYYDQNYNGFFVGLPNSSNVPIYSGDGTPLNITAGTNLTSQSQYSSYIGAFGASVIAARKTSYHNNPGTILDAVTQTPTALINNQLTAALNSNKSLQQALQIAAPILTSIDANFAFNDIATWPGGQEVVKKIQDLVNSHAAALDDAQGAVQRVTDFKKKILKQCADQATSLSQIQQQINQFKSQGTFTALTSAFPSIMGPFTDALSNHSNFLTDQISNFMPGQASGAGGVLGSVFSTVLGGGGLKQIMNPLDKIVNDIQVFDSGISNFINNFPVGQFGTLGAQTQFVNQIGGLLNNITDKFPISPNTINAAISDPQGIINGIAGSVTAGVTNALTQAVGATAAAITTTVPATSTDPSKGGSFSNIPFMLPNLPKLSDYKLAIPGRSYTSSPDPTIASNQKTQNDAKTTADQASTNRKVKRGDCINNISDVPLKPRSQPLDGSLGDYNGNAAIPF